MNGTKVAQDEKKMLPQYNEVVTSQPIPMAVPQMIISPMAVPNDYFGLALFTTICCFWPVGLFALIKSRNVHRAVWQNDMDNAKRSSVWAKKLSIIALIVGLVLVSIIITVNILPLIYDG